MLYYLNKTRLITTYELKPMIGASLDVWSLFYENIEYEIDHQDGLPAEHINSQNHIL